MAEPVVTAGRAEPSMPLVPWGRDRVEELAALVEVALPGEGLSADELLACCWDDPGLVAGSHDGQAAVAACARDEFGRTIGYVKLVAVHPEARRQGRGRAMLDHAHQWLFDQGAEEVRAGSAAPFYLWPGVDVAGTAALCLFEAAGYHVSGAEVNMRCPTSFRADPPPGVTVRRAISDEAVAGVLALVRRCWPWWEAETARAVEHGCCLVATDEHGATLGFACHSVNRAGWIGPMGTDPDRQHGGVGAALLGQACRDLMVAEFRHAEIAWVGPVGFYAKSAGATVSRTFRSLTLRRPAAGRAGAGS